ncbi:hypothetical protein [Flavobacterium sp. ASV13]|uniref:hypothetical protein n=1 Tax=Flavobacterium sp. ASV13 TaxID=1506583 RepID=UPI0006904136|nr:hypothetical protein [Flavobacterium sp. ASV13]
MKHYVPCSQCLDIDPQNYQYCVGEVNSDLVAVSICPIGHKVISRIAHHLFDVLYSSGVNAFLKGCYSESVMSFAASLERAYELFTKVTLHSEGLEYEKIDLFWKEIASQSERQYGAFCSQYLKFAKEAWSINMDMVKFRNKVIHKGHISTRQEILIYGEFITSTIYKILKPIHENYSLEAGKFYLHQRIPIHPKANKLMKEHNTNIRIDAGICSLLNWDQMDMPKTTFEEAVHIMSKIQTIH